MSTEILVAVAALAGSLGGALVSVGVPAYFERRRIRDRAWRSLMVLGFDLGQTQQSYERIVDYYSGQRRVWHPDQDPKTPGVDVLEESYRTRLEELSAVLSMDDQTFILAQFGRARFWTSPPSDLYDQIDPLDAPDSVARALGQIRQRLGARRSVSSVAWIALHPRGALAAWRTLRRSPPD